MDFEQLIEQWNQDHQMTDELMAFLSVVNDETGRGEERQTNDVVSYKSPDGKLLAVRAGTAAALFTVGSGAAFGYALGDHAPEWAKEIS